MDVYALTRKTRPKNPTLGEPLRSENPEIAQQQEDASKARIREHERQQQQLNQVKASGESPTLTRSDVVFPSTAAAPKTTTATEAFKVSSTLPSLQGQGRSATMPAERAPPPGLPQPQTQRTLPFEGPPQHHPGNHPKSPMYRPAVLRQTNSSSLLPTQSNFRQDGSRTQSISSTSGALETAPDSDFSGIVTGPPKRDHWKPDSAVNRCESHECNRDFGLFERRHHCRKCGKIFCSQHCSWHARLDQNADFNIAGIESRTCESCYSQYVVWRREKDEEEERIRRAKYHASVNSSYLLGRHYAQDSNRPYMPDNPVLARLRDESLGSDNSKSWGGPENASNAPTVPKDWSWSTF